LRLQRTRLHNVHHRTDRSADQEILYLWSGRGVRFENFEAHTIRGEDENPWIGYFQILSEGNASTMGKRSLYNPLRSGFARVNETGWHGLLILDTIFAEPGEPRKQLMLDIR
jgi:hypothetical protein